MSARTSYQVRILSNKNNVFLDHSGQCCPSTRYQNGMYIVCIYTAVLILIVQHTIWIMFFFGGGGVPCFCFFLSRRDLSRSHGRLLRTCFAARDLYDAYSSLSFRTTSHKIGKRRIWMISWYVDRDLATRIVPNRCHCGRECNNR